MGRNYADVLPDECWRLIFSRLDHHQQLETLSTVCKRFLSISNQLRYSFKVLSDPAPYALSQIFKRFPCLNKIDASELNRGLDALIQQISQSGLNIESLNLSNQVKVPVFSVSKILSLKTLICSRIGLLNDEDLIVIAGSLPWLEELDISYPEGIDSHHQLYFLGGLSKDLTSFSYSSTAVTDAGVEALSSKLKNLLKINLSGNHFISDRSLTALSSNCFLLREIMVRSCSFITQFGISNMIQHSHNLTSLSVDTIELCNSSLPSSFDFQRSSLCAIEFFYMGIPDDLFHSIVEAGIQLKKLTLSYCEKFTFSGIKVLLSTSGQSLEYIDLEGSKILTDESMKELSQLLSNVTTIKIRGCSSLTTSTFFMLAKNCPLLQELDMSSTNLGKEENFHAGDVGMNSTRIHSLKMSRNNFVNDDTLKRIGLVCRKLQLVEMSCCNSVTSRGIREFLNRFPRMRHLEVNQCGEIENVFDATKGEVVGLNLEVLRAKRSHINDEALTRIGKRCTRLVNLDLEGCMKVTTKGVKEVVVNCRELREMNLRGCSNVNIVDIYDWMVLSNRPFSLRKLVPPHCFLPKEYDKNKEPVPWNLQSLSIGSCHKIV